MENQDTRAAATTSINAKTWIPLGIACGVGVMLISVAITLGSDRASAFEKINSTVRTTERHEVEIKELRQRLNDDVSMIRAALARIEANQTKGVLH